MYFFWVVVSVHFVAGARFGTVHVFLFVAGAALVGGEVHVFCSWQAKRLLQ